MGAISNACIFDILYVFNYICVFCNLDFSDVIKVCKVKDRHRLGYFCIINLEVLVKDSSFCSERTAFWKQCCVVD